MTLLPQSYKIQRVFPTVIQHSYIKQCLQFTNNQNQIISCIREDNTERKKVNHLLISYESNNHKYQIDKNLNEINNCEDCFMEIDINGQDLFILFSDFSFFSYRFIPTKEKTQNEKKIHLEKITVPKQIKGGNITSFTIFYDNYIPIGLFGTSKGMIGCFKLSTGSLIKTITVAKKSIENL